MTYRNEMPLEDEPGSTTTLLWFNVPKGGLEQLVKEQKRLNGLKEVFPLSTQIIDRLITRVIDIQCEEIEDELDAPN